MKHARNELFPCIVCGKKKFQKWAQRSEFQALKCCDCGMISINPYPNQERLTSYYNNYFDKRLLDKKSFKQRKVVYEIDRKWITKFISHGNVLDIGCSGGHFLSTFNPKKWSRDGVEIERDTAEFAKKKYGLKVHVGNILDLSFKTKFDLVVLRGVIEHFSDPVNVLKKCSKIIKNGGFLFITATPAGDSFAFDVYRDKWQLFEPPLHLHFFTVKLLSRILKCFGFDLIDHHYQYEETPYANIKKDFEKIKKDIILIHNGKKNKVVCSPPFPGSMITAVWKKNR